MNLEYQYMVRPIPGKPRIDERRTFRRLRALVWTRARGLGGNFSRSPEKLLHRVKTARSCHRGDVRLGTTMEFASPSCAYRG